MFVPSNHLNDTIFKVFKKLSSFILDSLSNKMPKGGWWEVILIIFINTINNLFFTLIIKIIILI